MRIERTQVVIIGAGASGLTLAAFLSQAGISNIVLECRNREYIEVRQRAGVVDARNVRMFERRKLADKLLGGPVAQTIDYRLNGKSHVYKMINDGSSEGRFCTQQMLVNNLLKELLDERQADVRFNITDVKIKNEAEPTVRYKSEDGEVTILCDYIAGCDADRGVSRASIPDGALTTYVHEFGYAWLAALVEAPLKGDPIMGVSDHGFVGQLPRGPQRSRYYLQCKLSDGPADWPSERIWNEIRLRLNNDTIKNSIIFNIEFVPLRSVVHAPMQYNNLFLAGDAAHLLPPVSAKGMNLALFDVDVLADALEQYYRDGDGTGLKNYSDTVLSHVWNYQDFALWMADTMHNAGDPLLRGTFLQQTSRARLKNLFRSETAGHLHSEYQRGMN